jgi:hypothetical protein
MLCLHWAAYRNSKSADPIDCPGRVTGVLLSLLPVINVLVLAFSLLWLLADKKCPRLVYHLR